MNTLERIQYHVALVWRGTNLSKIYEEPGWESLTDRRWSRRLFHFYKIRNNLTPPYLKAPIPTVRTHLFGTRSVNVLNEIRSKSKSYGSSFYPDSIRCWNKIGPELRNSPTLNLLKQIFQHLLDHPILVIKVLYQLRVGLSPLRDHKIKHNFSDTLSDKCAVCNRTENLEHFFSHCTRFIEARLSLFNFVHTKQGQFCTH